MYLQTSHADAKFDGKRIILTIPSGTDSPQVAMSVHQALGMAHILLANANKVLREANRDAEQIAEIVPIRRRSAAA